MGAFIGPLLLVLLGVGGLVVVFGRHLKELRAVGDDRPAFSLRLQATGAPADAVSLRARARRRAAALLGSTLTVIRAVARGVGRVLKRPPLFLRVPRLASPLARRQRLPAAPPAPVGGALKRAEEEPVLRGVAGGEPELPKEPEPGQVQIPGRHADTPSGWSAADLDALAGGGEPPRVPEPASAPPRPTAAGPPAAPAAEGFPTREPSERPVRAPAAPAASAKEAPEAAAGVASIAEREGVARESAPVIEARVAESTPTKRKLVGRVRAGSKGARRPPASRREIAEEEQAGGERKLLPGSIAEVPALMKKGELARAESILIDRLTEDPRNVAAYRLLGLLYIQREDFAQAKEVLEEALRRYPHEASLFGAMGRTYFGLGQYGNALKMFQLAHDADETNLEYLERLLLIASRMDRRPLVRVIAEKILAVQPNHAEAKKHLAKVAA